MADSKKVEKAKPILRELVDYVDDVALEWWNIGLNLLDNSEARLAIINKDYSDNRQRCTQMFRLWLQIDTNASWEKLIRVLKLPAIGLPVVAEKIAKNKSEENILRVTVKDEMLRQLIQEHSKLISNLIDLFQETPIESLVRYFNIGNDESVRRDQIQGTGAKDFFNYLTEQQKLKYYAPDLLSNFVAASYHEEATKKIDHYINSSYHTLLKDFNLICESERITKEKVQIYGNKKLLHIKSEAVPLSSQKETFIRNAMCKCLKFPPNSVRFISPMPGCITLVYKYKMSDNVIQQVLKNVFLVKDLLPLANQNITWLRIDNKMELKIPSVKESMEDTVVSWTNIKTKELDKAKTAKPTIQKLFDYVKDLAPQWMDIGLKLMENSKEKLSIIEADHSNIQKCCREMLQLWLRIATDASWEQLIEILKSPAIGLPVIAENIAQNQLSGTRAMSGQITTRERESNPSDQETERPGTTKLMDESSHESSALLSIAEDNLISAIQNVKLSTKKLKEENLELKEKIEVLKSELKGKDSLVEQMNKEQKIKDNLSKEIKRVEEKNAKLENVVEEKKSFISKLESLMTQVQDSKSKAVLVDVIHVAGPHQITCHGQIGGSFMWNDCGMEITFLPQCSQQEIKVTMNAYLPVKHQICPGVYVVSAIYQFDCSIKEFDIPFILHLQHCVKLQSSEDCQKMCFISQHGNSISSIKDGNCMKGSYYSTVHLKKFCTKYIIWSQEINNQAIQIRVVEFPDDNESSNNHTTQQSSSSKSSCNNEKEQEQNDSVSLCYEWMLALPQNHLALEKWNGMFCAYVKLAAMRAIIIESTKANNITFPVCFTVDEFKFNTDGIAKVTYKTNYKRSNTTWGIDCSLKEIKRKDVDIVFYNGNKSQKTIIKSYINVTKQHLGDTSVSCQLIVEGIVPPLEVDLCTHNNNQTVWNTMQSRLSKIKTEPMETVGSGEERPTLKYLHQHVLVPVAPHWYYLGVNLLETYEELNIIQMKHKDDIKASCSEMFQLWLQRKPKASWNQLIESLRKPPISSETLANNIEKLLRTQELDKHIYMGQRPAILESVKAQDYKFLKAIKVYGSEDIYSFSWPYLLAKGPNGELIVGNNSAAAKHIVVLDENLKYLRNIGSEVYANDLHKVIRGIAVSENGVIYVTEGNQHCIQKFKLDNGEFIGQFGSRGSAKGQFMHPAGLLVTKGNLLFVCDRLNHRIQVLQDVDEILYLNTFGRFGYRCDQELGTFNEPVDITMSKSKQLFITDWRNSRIQVFEKDGTCLRQFKNIPHVRQPNGIFFTPDNQLLVASTDRVLIFAEDGNLLSIIKGEGEERFSDCIGVVMMDSGQIVISDGHYGIDRLLVFCKSI